MSKKFPWHVLKDLYGHRQSSALAKYDLADERLSTEQSLKKQLRQVDQQINEVSQSLLDAQVVSFRANLSMDSGFLGDFKRKIYGKSAQNSAIWHRHRLLELIRERNSIQVRLDRKTGQYWPKQIQRSIALMVIIMILIVAILVLAMGLAMGLSLLPIFSLAVLIYWFIQKLRSNS